jgi:hypothetical protein
VRERKNGATVRKLLRRRQYFQFRILLYWPSNVEEDEEEGGIAALHDMMTSAGVASTHACLLACELTDDIQYFDLSRIRHFVASGLHHMVGNTYNC